MLLDKLYSILSNKKNNQIDMNILSVKYEELNTKSSRTIYNSIYNEELNAVIIENFFSESEVSFFQENFNRCILKHADLIDTKFSGFTFGKTLFDTENLSHYKNLVPKYIDAEKELFNFSITDRFLNLIETLTFNVPVKIAKHTDNTSFLPNSVRVMEPDKGGLFVHADLYIHETFKEATELMNIINHKTVLSMIVSLQKPENGGNLLLYNLMYKDTPRSIFNSTKNIFKSMEAYVSKFKVNKIDLKIGSLIIFNAGQQWHAIEPIKGTQSRITVGCFTGYNKSNNEIYIWS